MLCINLSEYWTTLDWLIELSNNKLFNNKLSGNNLASKLVESRFFFLNQSQSRKFGNFMIKGDNTGGSVVDWLKTGQTG